MYFGLDPEKILLFAVVAALVIGPERLPRMVQALSSAVKGVRTWTKGMRSSLANETDGILEEIDWRKMDPRQYDPRRIIRDALLEDSDPPRSLTSAIAPLQIADDEVSQSEPIVDEAINVSSPSSLDNEPSR